MENSNAYILAESTMHVAILENVRRQTQKFEKFSKTYPLGSQLCRGFTLAEVLVTLGIIGVVAALTMPSLIQHHKEKETVAKLEKFMSVISQALNLWKAETGCIDDISTCISYISQGDSACNNFAPIAAKMHIIGSVTRNQKNNAGWLPDKAYNYYGEEQRGSYGGVSKITISDCAYLLNDGTIFSLDVNPTNFDMFVDVNGKKLPNRVGQDIFALSIGGNSNFASGRGNTGITKDIFPYPLGSNYNAYDGLCRIDRKCNPENIDPKKENGASPTSYVILTKKLPPKY